MLQTVNQTSRKDWDTYFMEIALVASSRATCPKRKVGAVVVDRHNHIISTGYNGSPPGEPHCTEVGCLEIDGRCKRTLHAEDNALQRAGRFRRRGGKIYTTVFPCLACAKLITKSGLVEVIYNIMYKRPPQPVIDLFEKEGIVIRQWETNVRKLTLLS